MIERRKGMDLGGWGSMEELGSENYNQNTLYEKKIIL